ncbi:hypothetical protein [uncultured Succinivibrio sp.]|uniref:hypothetical protein n=1 Tax=uncultured Succinivibrio sp. TaxID=540749 RepID=UPI0025D0C2A4|nr:hypothetical protein [uncultured Succinivibrio sp.]
MPSNNLQNILKILHRQPSSQVVLCKILNLSKAQIHKLTNNLLEAKLIDKHEDTDYKNNLGRPRQILKISDNMQYCTVLIIHTRSDFSAHVYVFGHKRELAAVTLPHVESAKEFAKTIDVAVDTLTKNCFISRALIKSIVIATHATVEQGEKGVMYRNNNLTDENILLGQIVYKQTKIRTFIYNFAYGTLLKLKNSSEIDTENALVINNGEGSVALGIFLNGEIQLGKNCSFPECSHLPYPHGFEKSLGNYGEYTEDALYFAISVMAPIYNLSNVIITGNCFKEHLDTLESIKERLKAQSDPRLHNIELTYRKISLKDCIDEMVYLSFDTLVDVLNPQMTKQNLQTIVSKIKYTN